MRTLLFFLSLTILSCQQTPKSSFNLVSSSSLDSTLIKENTPVSAIDTNRAKEWLRNTIIQFFDSNNTDMQSITTSEYYEFKMDAMNVDLDVEGSLTEVAFKKKWKDKFNLQLHPTQVGFLISGQDWGNIQVAEMITKNVDAEKQTITFKTLIRDEEFNVEYDRDIVLIEQDGQYLIKDVLEYD